MTSSPVPSGPPIPAAPPQSLRVVLLDRDVRRSLAITRALEARGARVSAHLSTGGFWIGVRRIEPTVIVLEVVPPLLSAARTVALATELLPAAPGVVLYGWAPTAALARLKPLIPNAIVLGQDEGPSALCAAVEAAHELARATSVPQTSAAPRAAPSEPGSPDEPDGSRTSGVRPGRRR